MTRGFDNRLSLWVREDVVEDILGSLKHHCRSFGVVLADANKEGLDVKVTWRKGGFARLEKSPRTTKPDRGLPPTELAPWQMTQGSGGSYAIQRVITVPPKKAMFG